MGKDRLHLEAVAFGHTFDHVLDVCGQSAHTGQVLADTEPDSDFEGGGRDVGDFYVQVLEALGQAAQGAGYGDLAGDAFDGDAGWDFDDGFRVDCFHFYGKSELDEGKGWMHKEEEGVRMDGWIEANLPSVMTPASR